MTLGPYALCLSYILTKAKDKKNSKIKFVYRGMIMEQRLFEDQYLFETFNHTV